MKKIEYLINFIKYLIEVAKKFPGAYRDLCTNPHCKLDGVVWFLIIIIILLIVF